jgi:uncharacterized protein YecE (DUF72 family)
VKILVGTSGWSYPGWRGSLYDADTPAAKFLAAYAEKLPTVEVNHTFRELPSERAVEAWRAQTPRGFVFALKAPATLTHFGRLQLRKREADCLRDFLAVDKALGARSGALYFQLPSNMRADHARLRAFVDALGAAVKKSAFELRHPSWTAESTALLEAAGAAVCIADGEGEAMFAGSWGYVRLRRDRYTAAALKTLRAKIAAQAWRRALVYVRHDDVGDAPRWAMRLAKEA